MSAIDEHEDVLAGIAGGTTSTVEHLPDFGVFMASAWAVTDTLRRVAPDE